MTIKYVELIHREAIKPGTMQDGIELPAQPEIFAFSVTINDMQPGDEIVVPNDPKNGHYREVAEWYAKQKKKPFKFDFVKLD